MIKFNHQVNISLDNIYNEIISIATSIGECKASIEHLENNLMRSNQDIANKIDKITDKVDALLEENIKRQQYSKMLWEVIQFSPGIIFKILSTIGIIVLLYLLPSYTSIRATLTNILN